MKFLMRTFGLGFLCVMMLLGLTGCECNHKYGEWKVDFMTHWHVCDKCGEEIHKEAHELELGNQCKICESYIYPDESGGTKLESYDEKGAKSYVGMYDEAGDLAAYQRFENTYFDNGTIESVKSFGYESQTDEEGTEKPLWENHFLPYENGEEGEVYLHLEVLYDTDGTKVTREYNEAGELVSEERS